MAIPSIVDSLDRLRSFRARWAEGDVIDTESGVTASDLDLIIHQAAGTAGEIALEDLTPEKLADLPGGQI